MQSTEKETGRVETFFHSYAAEFDSIYGSRTNPFKRWVDRTFRQSMYRRFQKTIEALDNPGIQSVLDVGCGSGRYALEYLRLNKEVVGIDLARGMLDLAEKTSRESYPKGKFEYIMGDYLKHGFSRKFDAAVLIGFFDYIRTPEDVFKKLRGEVKTLLLASFPRAGGLLGVQRKIRYSLRNVPLYLYKREDIDRIMANVGITDYEILDLGRDFLLKARP